MQASQDALVRIKLDNEVDVLGINKFINVF